MIRRATVVVAVVALAVIGWLWFDSRMPSAYSALDMGRPEYGGGSVPSGHAGHSHGGGEPTGSSVDVTDLVLDPARPADVTVTLVARQEAVRLANGTTIDGYTVNGMSPGPTIEAVDGQVVEVRFRNENVTGGATLHWHGMDVPNAMDGVAGVTQDAVLPGGEFVYRWIAERGTYWYHSHQLSHEQVLRGLFGAIVVRAAGAPQADDVVALSHTYGSVRTLSGAQESTLPAQVGSRVRVRIVNTDNGPIPVWVAGAPYRLVAVDGRDLVGPGEVSTTKVLVTAGGRADVEVVVPVGGVRVQVPGASIAIGSSTAPTASAPTAILDLLSYGKPAALRFDLTRVDRTFRYDIGRRPGFLFGKPGIWWSINGAVGKDVPMFMVEQGDVVRMTLHNSSGEVHPMHLHGHHLLVLSRNGTPSTGSPWWVDSLNVENGETYEVVFVADNPGIWMDHCHNLPHASEGLMTHLMDAGATTGFKLGTVNDPE